MFQKAEKLKIKVMEIGRRSLSSFRSSWLQDNLNFNVLGWRLGNFGLAIGTLVLTALLLWQHCIDLTEILLIPAAIEKVVGSTKMNNRKAAIGLMLKGSVLVSDAIA